MKRKILALLLACMMVISMVPATVYAEGEDEVTDVGTKDCTCGSPVPGTTALYTSSANCVSYEYAVYACENEGCGGNIYVLMSPPNGNHKWSDLVPAKDPTCLNGGNIAYYVCQNKTCTAMKDEEGNAVEDVSIPATGHHHEAVVTTPTCTADGYTTFKCACGDTYTTPGASATGHDYDEGKETTKPTCTAAGVKTFTCSCGATKTEPVNALGHAFGDATCDAPKTCTRCHETEGTELEHEWADATCTLPKTCKLCQATVGDALGHDWDDGEITLEPTCTEMGKQKHLCERCGEGKVVNVAATGHAVYSLGYQAPTCSEDGYSYILVCSVCEKTVAQSEPIPATGEHDYAAATCVAPETCKNKNCNATRGDEDPNNHGEAVEYPGQNPTCVTPGYEPYKLCSLCGELLEGKDEIPAAPNKDELHAWVFETGAAPTCTRQGFTLSLCANEGCSALKQDYEDALGHTEGEAATCTTPQICTVCKVTLKEALKHDYKSVVVTGPTCTEKGYTTYTCTRCDENTEGHSYVDNYVDEKPHSYNDGVVTTAPTCTKKGVKTYTCQNEGCTPHTYTEEVATVDHVYDEGVITDPTCTAEGYTTYTCSCGHNYTADTTEKVPHKYDYDNGQITTAPTFDQEGVKTFTCTTCPATNPAKETESIPALQEEIKFVYEVTYLNGKKETLKDFKSAFTSGFVSIEVIMVVGKDGARVEALQWGMTFDNASLKLDSAVLNENLGLFAAISTTTNANANGRVSVVGYEREEDSAYVTYAPGEYTVATLVFQVNNSAKAGNLKIALDFCQITRPFKEDTFAPYFGTLPEINVIVLGDFFSESEDVKADGKVNINDLVVLLRVIDEKDLSSYWMFDMDLNGAVEGADLIALRNLIAGYEEEVVPC